MGKKSNPNQPTEWNVQRECKVDLTVCFQARGASVPAVTSRPVEDCVPEEVTDTRTVRSMYIGDDVEVPPATPLFHILQAHSAVVKAVEETDLKL